MGNGADLQYTLGLDGGDFGSEVLKIETQVDKASVHMAGALKGIETSTAGVTAGTRSWFDALAHLGSNIASVVAGGEALGKTYTWVTNAVSAAKAGHGALAAIFPVEAAASRLAAAGANRMGAEAGAATVRVAALGTATTVTAAQTVALANVLPKTATGARVAGAGIGVLGSVAGGAAVGVAALGTAAAAALPILGAIAIAVAAVKSLGAGVGLANDFQQANIAFETLLGTAEQTKATLKELDQLAIETPFKTTDLQQAARLLLASRVPAEALGQELKAIGNIAAATGGDMSRLATVYGQVAGKGKLYAEELQQFVEQGAGELRQQLAMTLGVTTAQLSEMLSNGEVGFSALQKAIGDLAGPTGKWGQSMEKQSKSNLGLLSTIADSASKILRLFAQPIADGPLNHYLSKVADAAQTAATVVQAAIEQAKIGETLKESLILGVKLGINFVLDEFGNLKDRLLGILGTIGEAVKLALTGSFEEAKKLLADFKPDTFRFDATPQLDYFDKLIAKSKEAAKQGTGGRAWAFGLDATESGKDGAGSGGKGGKGKDPFDEILSKQEALDKARRDSAMDEMNLGQKVLKVREEIAAALVHEKALKEDAFGQDQAKILDAEKARVELQRELNDLLRQQKKEEEDLAKKARDRAEEARKERAEKTASRNDVLGELAILREQANGHDKKARAIQREIDLEKSKQDIMARTGATEADALRMAKEKQGLEDRIAKRKERDANRDDSQGAHIGGVTSRRMMGGGLSDFTDLQKADSDWDVLQKGKFGAGGLSTRKARAVDGMTRGSDSSVDATATRMGRMMGGMSTDPLSARLAASTTVAPPAPAPGKSNQQDPTLSKLDAILSELSRIRTT